MEIDAISHMLSFLNTFISYPVIITSIVIFISVVYLLQKKLSAKRKRLNPVDRKAFELLDRGTVKEFIAYFSSNKINPNLREYSQLFLLHKAVNRCIKQEKEGLELIRYLLEQGADVNCEDQSGRTPILMASHWSLRSAVDLLLQYHPNINTTDNKNGFPVNPLYSVMLKSSLKMAWFLIQRGFSVQTAMEIHNKKGQKFKLTPAQIEFLEKCQKVLESNERKKEFLMIWNNEHTKLAQKLEAQTSAELASKKKDSEEQKQENNGSSTINPNQDNENEGGQDIQQLIGKLNENEMIEILRNYL